MKTKQAAEITKALSAISGFDRLKGSKKVVAKIALPTRSVTIQKSFANLPHVELGELRNLNVADVLNHRYLLIVDPKESLSLLSTKLAK